MEYDHRKFNKSGLQTAEGNVDENVETKVDDDQEESQPKVVHGAVAEAEEEVVEDGADEDVEIEG